MMQETIVAEATPRGVGGLSVIRISGPQAHAICQKITGQFCVPRQAHLVQWRNAEQELIDQGIALYFKAPHSFTGEDVVEFQCHGSPIVVDTLLEIILAEGARIARPGEFSERAFLNEKLDLVQAEAISDLITAGTRQAAQAAMRSLSGEFSQKINLLLETLIQLRVLIEATLDFPEEEVESVQNYQIIEKLNKILQACAYLQVSAAQGVLLQEGLNLVIVGEPNVGKSTLLNALSEKESAIVSDIPGTTRDIIKERTHIAGIPLHVLDTAGLRDTEDFIEQEGVRRSKKALKQADFLILLADIRDEERLSSFIRTHLPPDFTLPVLVVFNKIDLLGLDPLQRDYRFSNEISYSAVQVSLRTGQGLDLLKAALLKILGWSGGEASSFSARRRHLDALKRAELALVEGLTLYTGECGLEFLAEACRLAQHALSEITGEFRSDDLLGQIFSSFCIGK